MGRRGKRSDARGLRASDFRGTVIKLLHRILRVCRHAAAGSSLLLLLLVGVFGAGAVFASTYVYDANGRLIAVTAPNGNAVEYSYDAVGNILSIQPITAGQLALFAFDPQQGAVGTSVTLQGNGFSVTPSSNTVKFNGTAATVISATVNQLVVKVPSGATTGPISVAVGSNSVTSATNFIVAQAPGISGFTPAYGNPGTVVTVSGTALDPVSGETKLAFGGLYEPISSITNTQVVASVVSDVGSGPIQVTTPYGQATTSADFIVVPAAIGAANVDSTAKLVASGGAMSLNINATYKYGVFVFNATAGQWLSVQLTSLTITPSGGTVSYQIYSPNNTQVASGWVSLSNMSIHLPVMQTSGEYLLVFGSGSETVQLSAKLEINPTIHSNGAPLLIATTAPAQSKRFIFSATRGQNLALGISNLTLNPSSAGTPDITVYNPDGSVLINGATCGAMPTYPSCGVPLQNLPQTGTYSIIVQPPGETTMSFTATLSPDVTHTLVANTPYTLNLADPGQEGLLTFTATAGQTVAVVFTGITTVPAATPMWIYIYEPNGTQLAYVYTYGATQQTFNLPNLTAGTYTVWVEPNFGVTATMQVTLVPGG